MSASRCIDFNDRNKKSFTWFDASSNPQSLHSLGIAYQVGMKDSQGRFYGIYYKGHGSESDLNPFIVVLNKARKED
jgi:hypothetical protein